MKILICSLIWCPEGDQYSGKASDVYDHIHQMLGHIKDRPEFEYKVINNNVRNIALLERLSEFPLSYIHVIPEKDWAGARNTALQYFMSKNFTHVLFLDGDAFMHPGWADKVLEVAKDPNIHAICEDSHPSTEEIHLENDITLYQKGEFFGLFNLLSRFCIETIGGFDCLNFFRYGYQDIDYGRRLLHSGLLTYTGNRFVSMYKEPLAYNKPAVLSQEEQISRNTSCNNNMVALLHKTHRVERKQDLYFDYNYTGPDVIHI
jgi:hypothetical protein